MKWRSLLIVLGAVAGSALASGVVRAAAESVHFRRTAETVMGMSSDGEMPDERGWRERAERKLREEVEHLETSLPRLRAGYIAAQRLVPLSDPQGHRMRVDLTREGWAWVELAFREEPSPQDLDAFRRALAQELQIRPIDKRRKLPIRAALITMAVIGVLVGGVVIWRQQRKRRPR